MTGRAPALTATGAVLVAVVAVAVLPLLSHHSQIPVTALDARPAVPPLVDHVAQRTARADLRCAAFRKARVRTTSGLADCGTLHVTRRQTSCTSSTRCTVDLIGNLHTKGLVVPIALTLTLASTGAGWRVIEVVS